MCSWRFALLKLWARRWRFRKNSTSSSSWNRRIEEQQKLNEELENQLEKGKTDQTEIVGKAAYEQYGYGYPDEHIYIDSQAS